MKRSIFFGFILLLAVSMMAAVMDAKVERGKTVDIQKVALVVTEAPHLVAAQFVANYDPQKLTFKGFIPGKMAEEAMYAINDKKPGEIRVALASGEPMVGDGILGYLVFAGEGSVEIKDIRVNAKLLPPLKVTIKKK